jgi:hypothetical protein
MSGVRLDITLRALLIVAACLPAAAAAQTPGHVRVTEGPARIQRWYRAPLTDVLHRVETGTTLEVLDEENGWYWVIVPPTAHGTRRAGWIRVRDVEPIVVPRRAPGAAASDQAASPNDSEADTTASTVEEDRVTITARDEAAAGVAFRFEDIHFERDRHMLRSEDMTLLQTAVVALKADPSLTVNLEGLHVQSRLACL